MRTQCSSYATASSHGVLWEADSAGLDLNPNNKGPVSGLIHKKFPTFVFKTKFWDVGDTDEMASAKAFAEMERQVGNLVEELQKGNTDLVRTD